jgi:hypothetical protein
MNPLRNTENQLKNFDIQTNVEIDKLVLNEVLHAQEEYQKSKSDKFKPNVWRIIMKSKLTKLAAAAVIIIAVGIGLIYYLGNNQNPTINRVVEQKEYEGAQMVSLEDGSKIKLYENTKIKTFFGTQMRNIEFLEGQIDVEVAKGEEPFIVKTAYGDVKALGTQFTMELVDDVLQDSPEKLKLLEVKVKEGAVEVSNERGFLAVKANQRVIVEKNKQPYDFTQDANLPTRLIERIKSMIEAMEKGDKRQWISNFNIDALYKLAKGKVKFEECRNWFSGMNEEDAQNFIKAFVDVESPEQMAEMMLDGINISDSKEKIYVRSVTIEKDRKHSSAECVRKKGSNRYVVCTPQWTYFDGDWWQTDD